MTDHLLHNEPALVQKIAEGDEKAFYELFRAYTPVLRAYVQKATRSDADTEEILQETFIRIWVNRDRLPEVQNLRAWIYTVAARICLNYLRAVFTRRKKMHDLALKANHHNAEWDTPLEITQLGAITQVISKTVRELSPQRRRIYRMNREEGMKPAAISEALSMPVGTVKNHLSAALREIRKNLTAAGYAMMALLYIFVNFF